MLVPELASWLVDRSRAAPPLPELFVGFCERLILAGVPVCRASLGLETLHPEESGTQLVWRDGALEALDASRIGLLTDTSYLNSPVRVVDETNRPFRWRRGESTQGMPLLDQLQADAVTDYVILPLPFLDDTRTATLSFATRADGGFAPSTFDELERAARLLSPWAERVVLRRIAIDLLAAYLGPVAGRLVYDGQIERGDVRTITAAIWFCDLRGFTALADRLPRREVVALLNRWFDVVGAAITAAGGEILKFMGDGLLAVFPIDDDATATCDAALAAAEAALAGMAALDAELAAEGREPMRFGLALHLGDLEHGNIGTAQRLDFTVIGPAVNLASRLEGLTKELGEPVLASAAFAAAAGRPLRRIGSFPLRGLDEATEVFAMARGEGLLGAT
ncbi:MAG TPA: adenylate/guanylate cyclase domain-containing protein [Geminicoccaceae bacterium]|nr:adenylate/guanylate cyclase domain-containing protein [Geminicoccaceae bacterium]